MSELRFAWTKNKPATRRQMAALFGALVLIAAVAAAASSSHGRHIGPVGAVDGSLSKSCDGFGCTSPDAARGLKAEQVWCDWRGDSVVVHALLTNTMAATVKLSIVPKYDIKNGGQHGTSFGSDIPVALAAGQSKDWTGNAGHPDGVATGVPISNCNPHLHDIAIGS